MSQPIEIVATMHMLQGRKPVPEVIQAQSEVLAKGAAEYQLTWDRIRLTLHSMTVEDVKVTVGSLLQRARSNPAQDWLDSNAANGLEASEDIYFDRPVYEPRGYIAPADREDRQKLDRLYARRAIRNNQNKELKPHLAAAIDRIKNRNGATPPF